MSITREQIPPRRKRQRTEASLSLDDPSESLPSKRLKSSTKLHSAAFYDSLSKVWLTRRALKELDRRTSKTNSFPRHTSVHPQGDREATWKNQIQRFARCGGPELRDLRGYPAPTNITRMMSSSSRNKQTKSTRPSSHSSSRRSSSYDNSFGQHLTDNHIYIRNRKSKPGGREEFQQRLSQPRPSLSPSCFSENAFESFQQRNEDVIDEGEVMRDVVPIICGNADIPSKQNLLFTRLDPIANDTTVDAKPDFYDGARLVDVDKKIRNDIGNFIIPIGHATAPVAPNFFLEVKRPSGGADVAKRQACYNGALGARAMHKLQTYGQDEPAYDSNAYTITSTYHDGTLKMYTTHPTQSVDGTTDYHMSQVNTWALTGNSASFREGVTAFRNARDWAQEQRDAFILAANERARNIVAEPAPFASSLDDATCHLVDVQDTAYPTEDEDSVDGDLSQPTLEGKGAEHLHAESSTFESSGFYDRSNERNRYPAEEETSSDELAFKTFPEPPSNKRRHPSSRKTVSKVPRYSDNKTRRRPSI